jgi:lipopolysaccharide transport system permease protein
MIDTAKLEIEKPSNLPASEPADLDDFDLVIEAGRTEKNYWRDLWRYRELFYFLAWRDILVRYKQTVIGVAWVIVRPFLTMVIFTLVFNRVAKLPAPGSVPYPLLVFAGMLPWQFFSTALSESSNSMIGNANLISKVYFPRLLIPAGSVITSFVDFLITLGLMVVMMIWYGSLPGWQLVALPIFIVLASAAALGAGLWLSALTVRYRDFRHIVPFIVQFGLFISPVGFSSSMIPERWRLLFSCNPLVGVIDGFRWSILGKDIAPYWPAFATSLTASAVMLVSGIWYFRRMERTFADVI